MNELLQELAMNLNTTVEHLWGVLVLQARVKFYQDVMFIIFTLVSIVIYIKVIMTEKVRQRINSDDILVMPVVELIHFITSLIIIITMIIVSIFALFNLPTLLLNPEYWALQQILDAIR